MATDGDIAAVKNIIQVINIDAGNMFRDDYGLCVSIADIAETCKTSLRTAVNAAFFGKKGDMDTATLQHYNTITDQRNTEILRSPRLTCEIG